MVRLCEDVEHDVLKATVRNFLINAGVAGMKKQAESRWCASRTSYACVMHALTASLLPLTIVPSLMRRLLMICSWSKTSFRPSAWRARGKGTFAQVERAVEILRGRRLPFGISCCYTSRNVEVIGSEEYFDQMIAWGAKFCWFFTYMPIGREAPRISSRRKTSGPWPASAGTPRKLGRRWPMSFGQVPTETLECGR